VQTIRIDLQLKSIQIQSPQLAGIVYDAVRNFDLSTAVERRSSYLLHFSNTKLPGVAAQSKSRSQHVSYKPRGAGFTTLGAYSTIQVRTDLCTGPYRRQSLPHLRRKVINTHKPHERAHHPGTSHAHGYRHINHLDGQQFRPTAGTCKQVVIRTRVKMDRKNGYAHVLSYRLLDYRSEIPNDLIRRVRERTSSESPRGRMMRNAETCSCRGWPVVHTYVHTLVTAGRTQHRTARAPPPREAPIWGSGTLAGEHAVWCKVLLPPY